MVDNSMRIAIDPLIDQDLKKEYQSYLDMNKYELIIWYFCCELFRIRIYLKFL